MTIKDIFSKMIEKFNLKFKNGSLSIPSLDDVVGRAKENDKVLAKQVSQPSSQRSLEVIQQGLAELLTQLTGINENLSKHVDQNEQLMSRIEHLPDIIETLPDAVRNQSLTVKALLNELKDSQQKELEFIRVIESIPREAVRQTDVLENINHQLSASAETDIQFVETFNKFKTSMEHLDNSTKAQTEMLAQMNKTFAVSDRYMKYLVSRQNRRFTWLFVVSLSVTVFSIIALLAVFTFLFRNQ